MEQQLAVEWFAKKLYEKFEMKGDGKVFNDLLEQAKKMENVQNGYSEEQVREMLFMALYEPEEKCCTTHTKDSIVRKVLKTFKSQ